MQGTENKNGVIQNRENKDLDKSAIKKMIKGTENNKKESVKSDKMNKN